MSNAIRCPECGSGDVECVEKPHHNHICHACGHSLVVPLTGPERVARAIEAGWHSACEGMAAVTSWAVLRRTNDPKPYHFVDVLAGDRQVQVSISPNGRSVRVFVDGSEVPS